MLNKAQTSPITTQRISDVVYRDLFFTLGPFVLRVFLGVALAFGRAAITNQGTEPRHEVCMESESERGEREEGLSFSRFVAFLR
jgi:hypothetical protein